MQTAPWIRGTVPVGIYLSKPLSRSPSFKLLCTAAPYSWANWDEIDDCPPILNFRVLKYIARRLARTCGRGRQAWDWKAPHSIHCKSKCETDHTRTLSFPSLCGFLIFLTSTFLYQIPFVIFLSLFVMILRISLIFFIAIFFFSPFIVFFSRTI